MENDDKSPKMTLDELDRMAAEKVMGGQLLCSSPEWQPTRNIAQAWECLDKFKWAEPEINWSDEQHCWGCTFRKGPRDGYMECTNTAAEAIVLACLKAHGEL